MEVGKVKKVIQGDLVTTSCPPLTMKLCPRAEQAANLSIWLRMLGLAVQNATPLPKSPKTMDRAAAVRNMKALIQSIKS